MSLSLRAVEYAINGRKIVRAVSGNVGAGELVALVGPNGAGKSTLLSLVSGFLRPQKGSIEVGGIEVSGNRPDLVSRLGVARMFQEQHVGWNLTALQNIQVSVRGWRSLGWLRSPWQRWSKSQSGDARSLLQRVGLLEQANVPARELSFGQLRLLALARAVAHPGALLLLDEPFTGLKSSILEIVLRILLEERKKGRAILVVDHFLTAIESVADRIWFMNWGRVTKFPSYSRLIESTEFVRDYRQEQSRSHLPARRNPKGEKRWIGPMPVLSLEGVAGGYPRHRVIREASLAIHGGEVVGVMGANGSGKSTLLRLIVGLAALTSGSVRMGEVELKDLRAYERIQIGLRFLPQEGRLLRELSVLDNELLAADGVKRVSHVTEGAVRGTLKFSEAEGKLKSRLAGTLSGGEQSRVALDLLEYGQPRVILLDEPTAGLDGSGRVQLERRMSAWTRAGIGVLVVEHDLKFLKNVATKMVVLEAGTITSLS